MLAWIFWTGRRRLHREYCGQSSPSVMQLTISIGPSSARTTCPTVMPLGCGQHVAALGSIVAVMSRCLASAGDFARSSAGI